MRAIYDHIRYVGGISNVILDKAIMLGAAAGRQKYQIYLDEVKEKATKKTKRKGLLDELDDLKS